MTEIIESIAVGFLNEDKHNEDDCPFCNSKDNEPVIVENVLEQEADEDVSEKLGLEAGIDGFKHKNCAGALGTALGGEASIPALKGVTRDDWEQELDVAYAAHHLIPGNGSLAKSDLYKCGKYLRYEGQKEGNIGYNINCAQNGVWLPGNYAYSQKHTGSEWGPKGKTFKSKYEVSPQAYVARVIEKSGRQFHDAHSAYNRFVKSQLNKIKDKLDQGIEQPWCPEGKKREESNDEAVRPLYILVGRLGHISSRMKRKLTFPTSGWNTNIYTSSFSNIWMESHNNTVSSD